MMQGLGLSLLFAATPALASGGDGLASEMAFYWVIPFAGMPSGRWAVALQVEGGASVEMPLGHLRGEGLSADEVDSRVRDALLAARRHGVDVRVGVANSVDEAEHLAETAAANHVRIEVGARQVCESPTGRVIVGPWADSAVPVDDQRQLSLFDLGRRSG